MKRKEIRKQHVIGKLVLGGLTVGVLVTALSLKWDAIKDSGKMEIGLAERTAMATMEGSDIYEGFLESSTEAVDVQVVATPEPSPYDGRFIANITDTLNVRASASTESEVVGKMYPGCVGDIVGTEGDWTQITSGNVSGYVKTEYILSGKDAEPLAEEYGKNVGTVTGDIVKVRRDADVNSEAIGMLEKDDEIYVTETLDGWYGVLMNENWYGYVSADYLSVEYKLDTAITIEEELARIAAAKAAETQAAQEQAEVAGTEVETTQQEPTQASYEGQLAVANVVLNRLHSGYYGSTISDVIYAKGQFPSVNGSVMTSYLNNGPLVQAQQAANEALSGVNNIGGYMCFINVKYANYAAYGDDYTIIGNHCFH